MRKDLPPQNQNKSPQATPEKGRYRLPHISKKVPKDEFEIAKDNPKNSLRFGLKNGEYIDNSKFINRSGLAKNGK